MELEQTGVLRRTITKSAAWAVPVVTLAVTAPQASASLTPGLSITPGNGPWDDDGDYDGYIAEGIVITMADANGLPLANVPVTLTLAADINNFWFVSDPTISAEDAQDDQSSTITLVTDANGQIHLDDGVTGWLRKGSDGESDGTSIRASAVGATTVTVSILNSSAAGGTNPGIAI